MRMEYKELMETLEQLGTEQNRKIYKRHGASEPLFGVSYANFKVLKKNIKADQELAVRLWESGNTDARILASMIADPKAFDENTIDTWLKEITYCGLLDEFVYDVVAKTEYAHRKQQEWILSKDEWIGRAGWCLVTSFAMDDKIGDEAFFEEMLKLIELEIQSSVNRKKEGMHNALLAIGIRSEHLEKKAIEAANRIGDIVINHGETSCKTPDTIAYIKRGRSRKK
ncbi:MAG: DNA alkylation repair protein [Mobilitalea sp.]